MTVSLFIQGIISDWLNIFCTYLKIDAANDAHCSLMVYKTLMAIAAENAMTLAPATYTSRVIRSSAPKIRATTALAALGTSATTATDTPNMEQTTNLPQAIAQLSKSPFPNAAPKLNQDNRPRPQHMRAYKMWHLSQKPLHVMCAELTTRGEPLKESTVM